MDVLSDVTVEKRIVRLRATKKEIATLLGYDGFEVTLVFNVVDGWQMQLESQPLKDATNER